MQNRFSASAVRNKVFSSYSIQSVIHLYRIFILEEFPPIDWINISILKNSENDDKEKEAITIVNLKKKSRNVQRLFISSGNVSFSRLLGRDVLFGVLWSKHWFLIIGYSKLVHNFETKTISSL